MSLKVWNYAHNFFREENSKETFFPFNIDMMRVNNIWKEFKREQLLSLSSCVILNVDAP